MTTGPRPPGPSDTVDRDGLRRARVGGVVNGASLAAVALLGLANGLSTDGGVSIWRVSAYPLIAVLAYLHGRFVTVHGGAWVLVGIAVTAVPLAMLVSPEPIPAVFWEAVSGLMSLAVVVVLPWLAARSRRQQAELVRAGQREVEQLKREREYVSERARSRERARIATDVHDALGHELALIALRAGALELSPELSEPNRLAASELRASAVKATDRLRETIGMLREDAAPTRPADETVTELVERAVAAGMDVTLTHEPPASRQLSAEPPSSGDQAAKPSDAARPLPPAIDRAAHRVVREALTNAARHAPGAAVTVRLRRTETTLEVVVTNGTTATSAQPGTGSGLAGLAERVRLVGGEFAAGPDDSGFTVTARLPMTVVT